MEGGKKRASRINRLVDVWCAAQTASVRAQSESTGAWNGLLKHVPLATLKSLFPFFLNFFPNCTCSSCSNPLLQCPSTKREHRGVEWPAEARAVNHAKKLLFFLPFYFLFFKSSFLITLVPPAPSVSEHKARAPGRGMAC